MLVRTERSGSSTDVVVNLLPTDFIAAVSSAISTSNAQEAGGTATIDVSSFTPTEFASLHIMSTSFDSPAIDGVISGTFVSGNIFGGDIYDYTAESIALKGPGSQSVILIPAQPHVVPPIMEAAVTGGNGGVVVPTEGQIFPRGVCS